MTNTKIEALENAFLAPSKWWRRPWIVPLAAVVAGFLVFQVSPFARAGLDETKAPIPPHKGFSIYYPLLIGHITFGTVTMVTVIFQLWPRFRHRHPTGHRWTGRVYVVAALITGVIGLVILRFAPPVGQIGVSMATVLWLGTTVTGFVMARRGRFALHRRFMLYSFALVMNNVWGVLWAQLTMRAGIDLNQILEGARWIGWVGDLILVQWWLYRTSGRPLDLPSSVTGGQPVAELNG